MIFDLGEEELADDRTSNIQLLTLNFEMKRKSGRLIRRRFAMPGLLKNDSAVHDSVPNFSVRKAIHERENGGSWAVRADGEKWA